MTSQGGTISSYLDAILGFLRGLERAVTDLFLPGLDGDEVRRSTGAVGLSVPNELVELYACHNGTAVLSGDYLDDLHFFPGFYWLSLGDGLEVYRSISNDRRWDARWFPLFSNGGGDFYAAICDPSSPLHGAVVGFMVGEDEHPIEYASISSMLKVILRCYEEGVFFVSTQGYLEANDPAHEAIAQSELRMRQ